MSEPGPSARARELVRGGYDMHVHIAPDVVERKISDVALARRCAELGLAGFQLKSHYSSTAERARTVSEAVAGVQVLGAITLNRAVGGLNALAVEIAAREGARTVWFPTVNSANEQHEVHPAPPGAKLPVWVAFELELREAGHRVEPVAGRRRRRRAARRRRTRCSAVIARHGMVLATGHLSRDEIFTLVDGGGDGGRDATIVVTHPEFPSQRLSIADQHGAGRARARCSSAASPRRTPARRRGSSSAAPRARSVRSTPSGPATSASASTRRSRTASR